MAINAPEGTRDLLPDEALFWNQFKQTAAEVFVELESDSQEMLINGFSNTELQEVLD